MRKDFKNLDIYAAFKPANGAEWQKANGIHADWKTPEHIEVKHVCQASLCSSPSGHSKLSYG